jgi:hypothetical protein
LLASVTACTNANSASRVPLTGNTMVSGDTDPAGNWNRRVNQLAIDARS